MSVITTTYPVQSATPESGLKATPSTRHPWRFWSTLGWLLLANAALVGVHHVSHYADIHRVLPFDRSLLGPLTTILSMLAAVLVLALAAGRRGPSARLYLNLVWPRWHHVLIALGAYAALYVALLGLEKILPPTVDRLPDQLSEYRDLLAHPTQLVFYWLVAVVSAPIFEEIIFRGFLLRGWSESRVGIIGALLLSTLIFTQAHTQYDVRGMLDVFAIGLAFGLVRWWSGSTILAIMMHMGWNGTNHIIIAFMA